MKFIFSEKATNVCEISTVDLPFVVTVKSTMKISKKKSVLLRIYELLHNTTPHKITQHEDMPNFMPKTHTGLVIWEQFQSGCTNNNRKSKAKKRILYTCLRGPSCKMIAQEECPLQIDSMGVFFVFSKLLASTEPMSQKIYESPRPRRLAKKKKRKTKTASKNYPQMKQSLHIPKSKTANWHF